MNTEDSIEDSKVRLDKFNSSDGLERGRSKTTEILWYLFKIVFFLSALPWPQGIKRLILNSFGAKVGTGVVIKPRVNIHFPWKLEIADHVWIGEECFILNFEPIVIGSHSCLSQRTFLCGGNHDFRSTDFRYRNGPISISNGVWLGANSFIGPNVTIGTDTVVGAGSVVNTSLPPNQICKGNPCIPISQRWKD